MIAPITIEIIIYYYCTADNGEDYRDSPAFRTNAKMLVEHGLLIETGKEDRKYTANREACKIYIDTLCSIPFPEMQWIIPTNT